MEVYFDSFNFEQQDLYNNYCERYNREISDLIFDDNVGEEKSYRDGLKCLQTIAIRTGKALEKNTALLKNEDVQQAFFLISEKLIQLIRGDFFNLKEDFEQINKIFKLISEQPTLSAFKFKFYSALMYRLREEGILRQLDDESFSNLTQTLLMRLNLDSQQEELSREMKEICSSFRFLVENYFTHFQSELLIRNIHLVQQYYEFSLKCCSSRSEDPYKFIAGSLLRMVSYYKQGLAGSIYFDLPSSLNSKERFHHLVDLFRSILLSEQMFDKNAIWDFSIQIRNLFTYNEPKKGYNIFLENHEYLYENLFDIFMQTRRVDTLFVLSKIRLNPNDVISKVKTNKFQKFNQFLLNRLIECSLHFKQTWNYLDKEGSSEYVDLELFTNFIFDPINYIYNFKDRSCSKLCLRLAVSLLQISLETSYDSKILHFVRDIFHKENFYLLIETPDEARLILELIAKMAAKIETDPNIDINKKNRDYESNLRSCLEDFVSNLIGKSNNLNELIKMIHQDEFKFFDLFVFEPIESEFASDEYFHIVNNIMSLVAFEYFPRQNVHSLRDLYKKANTIEHFEALSSADSDSFYRVEYYRYFFEKIIDSPFSFDDELSQTIDICTASNNFIDKFQQNKPTFYFRIGEYLSRKTAENKNARDTRLIEKCISFWLEVWTNLYEKSNSEMFENEMRSLFGLFINQCCRNHKTSLAKYSHKLWHIYLEMNCSFNHLIYPLSEISQLCMDIFMRDYSSRFAKIIFESALISINYPILLKLAEFGPDFYFQTHSNSNHINILEIFSLLKTRPNELSIFMGILTHLNITLESKGFVEKSSEKILFENRRNFHQIIFSEENKSIVQMNNFSLDFRLRAVCDIYKYLASLGYETKLLLDELVDLFKELFKNHKEAFILIITIETIARLNEKQNVSILKQKHHSYLVDAKKANKSSEIDVALESLINLIEGKNLNTFTANIEKLEKTSKKHELKITNLNKNVIEVGERVEKIEDDLDAQEKKLVELDEKTLFNLPTWCKDLAKLLDKDEWILVAKRLNFDEKDVKAWLNQHDPCLSMLQEWFIINKTADAINGLLLTFRQLNYLKCVDLIEKSQNEIQIEEESKLDESLVARPPQIFICYEWSSKGQAELVKKHLERELNDLRIWFDDGNMGGGANRNGRIDVGLRSCSVLICLISQNILNDKTCLSQINLAVQLNKAIIPLLIDSKLKWPPQGSLGPIMSEYLFIRFYQRAAKEVTNDERFWPVEKFDELKMQISQLVPSRLSTNQISTGRAEVFISYQWDKQKDIIRLHEKLTHTYGLTVWLDIYEMGGGDSLYEKIDNGLRNCDLLISCVTTKYGLSANCRKEIALADSLSKPIIPILLEKNAKYPPPGPMAPTLSLIKCIDFTSHNIQMDNTVDWSGDCFDQLLITMREHLSKSTIERVTNSQACSIS